MSAVLAHSERGEWTRILRLAASYSDPETATLARAGLRKISKAPATPRRRRAPKSQRGVR